jgi:hypothetical protein
MPSSTQIHTTQLLRTLGTLNNGPRKPSNNTANGRRKHLTISTNAMMDSTEHLELKRALMEENAPPLKEDTIWMLTLFGSPITLKKRKQS